MGVSGGGVSFPEPYRELPYRLKEGFMRRFLCGLAALPFLTAVAWAAPAPGAGTEPVRLTSAEMDRVSAGFFEIDRGNTSVTQISIFQRANLFESTPNAISCATCFLLINSSTISVSSQFGP